MMSKRNKKRSTIKKKHRRMKQHELEHQSSDSIRQKRLDRHQRIVNYISYHLKKGNFSVSAAAYKFNTDQHTIYSVLKEPRFVKLYQQFVIDKKKLIFENGVDGRTLEYANIDEAANKTGYAAGTIREALYMKKPIGEFKVYRKMNTK